MSWQRYYILYIIIYVNGDDCNNLHKAIDSDNKSEICEKYSNDEVRFYKSTHKLSNDVRVQELDDLFGGLSNDERTVDSAQYN